MFTSPNMGLIVWNLTSDRYDHDQQADNWRKVDQHDHSSGKGLQVPTGGIADGAITAAKIDAPTLEGFQGAPPYALASFLAAPTISTGGAVVLAWDTTLNQRGSMHNTSVNPERFTAQRDGLYSLNVQMLWDDPSASGYRQAYVTHSTEGIIHWERSEVGADNFSFLSIAKTFELAATEYVTVSAVQDSGGDIDLGWYQVGTVLIGTPKAQIVWLGDS